MVVSSGVDRTEGVCDFVGMQKSGHEASDSELGRLLAERQSAAAREVAAWFATQMDPSYFALHTDEEVLDHLRAVLGAGFGVGGGGAPLAVECTHSGCRTHVVPGRWVKDLLDVFEGVQQTVLRQLQLHTTADGRMRLLTLTTAEAPHADPQSQDFAAALAAAREAGLGDAADVRAFLASATASYVDHFPATLREASDRGRRHYQTFVAMRGEEGVRVRREATAREGQARIAIGVCMDATAGLCTDIFTTLARHGVGVSRAYMDQFDTGSGTVVIASIYVDEAGLDAVWPRLEADLAVLKWHPRHGLDQLADTRGWALSDVMLLQAACEYAHQMLIRENLWAYTSDNIIRQALAQPALCEALVDFFRARHDPALGDDDRADREADALQRVESLLPDVAETTFKRIFTTLRDFFDATLRTNHFVPGHFGLAFRLDPARMAVFAEDATQAHSEVPYGVWFFHGPHALGFHVRYRATARGGLRIVPTASQARFEVESRRLLDEVVGLARAQQLKNKDIPEGGAKAVLLLGPDGNRHFALKACVDALLDCLVEGEHVRDLLEHPSELLYLGPDENIEDWHIEWIVGRAAARGYPMPGAFMSSKPGAGINHRAYGVTSRGVVAWVEETLAHLGIDPARESFRVKMTGGPRGDVAGNCMRILAERYPRTCCIVAVADSSGAAYDPEGLNLSELVRLVDEVQPIARFDEAKLSDHDEATVQSAKQGARLRDTLHNTAEAEVFVPAGGRPHTIDDANWQAFLREDGSPSARAIVEGANIFLTPGARDALQEAGVAVVRDASANKAGVICSSYEILAAMCVDEAEFLELKQAYVADVLNILDARVRAEARRLFADHRRTGTPLTRLSDSLSREINRVADAVAAELCRAHPGGACTASIEHDPQLATVLHDYLPPSLRRAHADRIFDRLPVAYQSALVAADTAARIVYAEGEGWLDRAVTMARRAPNPKQADSPTARVLREWLASGPRAEALLAAAQGHADTTPEARNLLAELARRTARAWLVEERLNPHPTPSKEHKP